MTAHTETGTAAPAGEPRGPFWTPGEQVLWRYRGNGTDAVHIARPVTVVRDDPELLAVWMAPNTPVVRPVIADGTPVHREPLATRYVRPRTTRVEKWWGAGVLKLARPGEPWSVWLFWDQEWRFKSWYVNLEEPLRRWSAGVDSEDHFLDISVHRDRSWRWLDEDEFAQAQADGLMPAELAARVRRAGLRAVAVIRAWGPPFADHWEDWRPDPRWPVPELPADWDRPPDAPGDRPGDRAGGRPGGRPDDRASDRAGDRSGDCGGDRGGDRAADRADTAGDRADGRTVDRPGDRPGDRAGDSAGDRFAVRHARRSA